MRPRLMTRKVNVLQVVPINSKHGKMNSSLRDAICTIRLVELESEWLVVLFMTVLVLFVELLFRLDHLEYTYIYIYICARIRREEKQWWDKSIVVFDEIETIIIIILWSISSSFERIVRARLVIGEGPRISPHTYLHKNRRQRFCHTFSEEVRG